MRARSITRERIFIKLVARKSYYNVFRFVFHSRRNPPPLRRPGSFAVYGIISQNLMVDYHRALMYARKS